MIKSMDMENIHGLMEKFMKGFGYMENNMEKVFKKYYPNNF